MFETIFTYFQVDVVSSFILLAVGSLRKPEPSVEECSFAAPNAMPNWVCSESILNSSFHICRIIDTHFRHGTAQKHTVSQKNVIYLKKKLNP